MLITPQMIAAVAADISKQFVNHSTGDVAAWISCDLPAPPPPPPSPLAAGEKIDGEGATEPAAGARLSDATWQRSGARSACDPTQVLPEQQVLYLVELQPKAAYYLHYPIEFYGCLYTSVAASDRSRSNFTTLTGVCVCVCACACACTVLSHFRRLLHTASCPPSRWP